jgi:hypothetical protein
VNDAHDASADKKGVGHADTLPRLLLGVEHVQAAGLSLEAADIVQGCQYSRCLWLATLRPRNPEVSLLPPGAALAGLAWPFNLRQLGNSLAIWLGINPWQLFFYIFLPPLLLDAAVRIDWYMFRKVGWMQRRCVWVVRVCVWVVKVKDVQGRYCRMCATP